jgi:hypothetical protein
MSGPPLIPNAGRRRCSLELVSPEPADRRFLTMNYGDYFNNVKGHGVLATADSEGKVNVAIYARPHMVDDGTLAFIMRDRLTHANLQSNPHAAYLFREDDNEYKGLRLYLSKVSEEKNTERVQAIRRKSYNESDAERGPLFLVLFKVNGCPLWCRLEQYCFKSLP